MQEIDLCFAKLFRGSYSNIVLSFFMYLKIFLLNTKKPPLTHPPLLEVFL